MDIQKEREAFEDVFPCSTGTALNEYGHYESQVNQQDAIIQNISWVVWQAAKAQAVPDGFVVVPEEPTERMLDNAYSSISDNLHYADLENIYRAMIWSAQEPK